jgi:GNAT superfamily N-acetyltransferase
MNPTFRIRNAEVQDIPLILKLIQEIADYEKLSHEVVATEEDLKESLFGEKRSAEVVIGEFENEVVGYALFFHNFSTFLGRKGLYLEDLFVRPQYRGKGFGKSLLLHLVKIAKERKCGRMEWSVLDWNTPAIEFYKSLGARPMDEWTVYRLDEQALDRLAQD